VPVRADTETSTDLDVGDEWVIGVEVLDDDGYPATAVVTVTVTDPSGAVTTPTPVEDPIGTWTATHAVTIPGRYLAVVTTTGVVGAVPFTAWASTPTDADGLPTTSDCVQYLGETSVTDAEILDALQAEAAAQRHSCRVPAVYPPDLRQALLRRVARNLAARAVPLTSFTSFEGGGTSTRIPRVDVEIARFEGPFRRRKVG
jgi:hypothetical protein